MLYDAAYTFEFGMASFVYGTRADDAFIVTSGRGVHEAIAAARECVASGVRVAVIDMPSIDEDLLLDVCDSGKVVCVAEQNNGYILQNLLKVQHRRRPNRASASPVVAINTLDRDGRPQFIHSGTYEELVEAFGLTPSHIANAVRRALNGEHHHDGPGYPRGRRRRAGVAGETSSVAGGEGRHRRQQLLRVRDSRGAVHMLHNTGREEMKVVCFFAPATGLDNYRLHEGVDFPD